MKKLLIMSTSLLSSVVMAGMPVNHPIGSSFTLSSTPNQRALSTSLGNPAAPFLMVNEIDNNSFRFGTFGPLGIGIEVGDVSDLDDQVEALEYIIDNGSTQADVTKANEMISDLGDTAYTKTSINMQVPFMPIIYKTKNSGAFILDSNISVIGKGSLLSGSVVRIGDSELITDTSFYAQTVKDLTIGLGYSQSIWEKPNGMLVGGVKANLHQISLGRALVELDDDSTDAGDAISNSFSDDAVSSSDIGLDLGIIWISHYSQMGLTIANVNEPEFDGALITSNSVSNRYGITAIDSYTMKMQTTIDAAFSTLSKQIMLGMSYDANSVEDAVGDKYQWAAASLSYYGDSSSLPSVRIGYRQNMAGSKLSYASLGLTLFRHLSLDVALSLDTVEDEDGEETPRSYYFSIGYDTAF